MSVIASEKNFENRVKKFLKDNGCWFLKYWGGGEFTKAGVPDLISCVNGFFVGVEIKAPNGKPSALQIHNLKKIDNCGGAGILLYPDDFGMFQIFIINLLRGDLINAQMIYEELKGRWLMWEQRFK